MPVLKEVNLEKIDVTSRVWSGPSLWGHHRRSWPGLPMGWPQPGKGEWQESGAEGEQPEGKQVGCQQGAECCWLDEEAWNWGLVSG